MNLDIVVNELNKCMDEALASGDACTFGELKSIKREVIRIIGNGVAKEYEELFGTDGTDQIEDWDTWEEICTIG